MDEINMTVKRHLEGQRDHDEVLGLWEQIWARFRSHGALEVERLLDDLLVHPDAEDMEDGR